MRVELVRILSGFLLIAGAVSAGAIPPCTGVVRHITDHQKIAFAPTIAAQLQVKAVDIMSAFQVGDWAISYVYTDETDDAYVFYEGDPSRSRYMTLWGGAALENEERAIRTWTIKNAPGIPPRLAHCFAWHVTKEH